MFRPSKASMNSSSENANLGIHRNELTSMNLDCETKDSQSELIRRDSTSSLVSAPSALWLDDISACSNSSSDLSCTAIPEEWETLESEHFVPPALLPSKSSALTQELARNMPTSLCSHLKRHRQSLRMVWDFGLFLLSLYNLYSMNHSILRQDFQSPSGVYSMTTNFLFLMDILLNVATHTTPKHQQQQLVCLQSDDVRIAESLFDLEGISEHERSDGWSLREDETRKKPRQKVQLAFAWSLFCLLLNCLIDVMAIVPIEHWYIRPLVELERRRGFWRKVLRRTKVVGRVTVRILRSSRWIPRVFRVIVQATSRPVWASWRGIRWSIRCLPKYMWFVRHAAGKGVLLVRFLRLARYLVAVVTSQNNDDTSFSLYDTFVK